MACNWIRFAYRVLPLPAWRALLLDRHLDRCPACQGRALGDEAIRSLGITPGLLESEPPLRPFASGGAATPPRAFRRFRWSYAFGLFLAVTATGALVFLAGLVPRAPVPAGRVTISEDGAAAGTFAVLESRIGEEPARPVIFKPGPPGMTIVWFEKTPN